MTTRPEPTTRQQLEDLKQSLMLWIASNPAIGHILAQKKDGCERDKRLEESLTGITLMWYDDIVTPLLADYIAFGGACSYSHFSTVISAICYRDGDLGAYLKDA